MSDLFSHFVAPGGLKSSKLLPPTPNKIKISIRKEGNTNLPLQYKSGKVIKFGEQDLLKRLQMVQFECPMH